MSRTGEVIGSYRLEEKVGEGAMGSVYRAVHTSRGHTVAVKVLATHLAVDEQYVSRFFHEARVVNELNHPNIVEVLDFISLEEPIRIAAVMELLPGLPLDKALRGRPFSLVQAINATLQLCSALKAVHAHSVIHRDLKPENIFIVGSLEGDLNEVPSIKILDFGIAKIRDKEVKHRTATGAAMGTPAYMSPEQILGEPVTEATDVYAMGELFYEMLTGHRVFQTKGLTTLSVKMSGELPPLALPLMPGQARAESLIARCLGRQPSERPSLAELELEVGSILNDETEPLGMQILSGMPLAPVPETTSQVAPQPMAEVLPEAAQGSGPKLMFLAVAIVLALGLIALYFLGT